MFTDQLETLAPSERKERVFDINHINRELQKIHDAEMAAEPWKKPGQELMPWSPVVLHKFGYKSWDQVPIGQ